jgi:hypothetical protein
MEDKTPDDDISYLFPATSSIVQPNQDEDLSHLFGGKKPQTEVDKNIQKQREKEILNFYGPTLGATAAGMGYGTRAILGQGIDLAKEGMADVLQRAFPNLLSPNTGGNQSPGGKWFDKVIGSSYTAPQEDTAVKGSAESYQRQKARGKVTEKLEKKFGKLTPNKLNISGQGSAIPVPERPSFFETPAGQVLKKTGNFLTRGVGDVSYGALHGLNAVQQAQDILDSKDMASKVLHGASATGSALDVLSNVLPEQARYGVRQLSGPLALGGLTLADIYDALSKGEYGQAVGATALAPTFLNPVTAPIGMYGTYLRKNPEEAKKASEALKNPEKWSKSSRFYLD